jgi:hypothetical protein
MGKLVGKTVEFTNA